MKVRSRALGCVQCRRGDCHRCTGLDGPITEHPDSLPLCACDHAKAAAEDGDES